MQQNKNKCVNWKTRYGFIPINFERKIVFIGKKNLWDILFYKEKIPTIYLPNSHNEKQTKIKSMPELEDCIAYITPKYEICYEEILRKQIYIDTIIVYSADKNCISQIIQDQSTYKFKLIILTNDLEVQKYNGLTLWDWKKEEIELMEKI